jgi:hypothetical protein
MSCLGRILLTPSDFSSDGIPEDPAHRQHLKALPTLNQVENPYDAVMTAKTEDKNCTNKDKVNVLFSG